MFCARAARRQVRTVSCYFCCFLYKITNIRVLSALANVTSAVPVLGQLISVARLLFTLKKKIASLL